MHTPKSNGKYGWQSEPSSYHCFIFYTLINERGKNHFTVTVSPCKVLNILFQNTDKLLWLFHLLLDYKAFLDWFLLTKHWNFDSFEDTCFYWKFLQQVPLFFCEVPIAIFPSKCVKYSCTYKEMIQLVFSETFLFQDVSLKALPFLLVHLGIALSFAFSCASVISPWWCSRGYAFYFFCLLLYHYNFHLTLAQVFQCWFQFHWSSSLKTPSWNTSTWL